MGAYDVCCVCVCVCVCMTYMNLWETHFYLFIELGGGEEMERWMYTMCVVCVYYTYESVGNLFLFLNRNLVEGRRWKDGCTRLLMLLRLQES